jgi:hypothetical protein
VGVWPRGPRGAPVLSNRHVAERTLFRPSFGTEGRLALSLEHA